MTTSNQRNRVKRHKRDRQVLACTEEGTLRIEEADGELVLIVSGAAVQRVRRAQERIFRTVMAAIDVES